MPNSLEIDRINQLMARPPFVTEDQTSSPLSFEDWSETDPHSRRRVGQADLAFFLVNGTGAMHTVVAVPRHPVATSPRSSLWRQDFTTWVENSYVSLLLEFVSRLVQPRNTRAEISTIKFNLGLNLSQLAEVLGVRRPTIYSWLDEEAEVRIQPENQRRIQQLASYAEIWWTKAGRQLPKELLDSSLGSLLLDLLRAEILNDQLIRQVIEALCAELPAKRRFLKVEGVGPVPEGEPLTLDEFMD
jgi:hypothetical protein